MFLLYHAYVYLEFLILACTIYILAPVFLLFHEISMLPETKIMYEKRDGYEINKMVHLYFLKQKEG